LDPEVQALVCLSAALAGGDPARIDETMDVAADSAPARQVEEALLQSYLFLGYPAALNGLARWRRRVPGAPVSLDELSPGSWAERGAEVCRVVYGGQYEGLRQNVRALHPEMEEWMVREGYGKVLGRPGLSLARRELCIVAVLAVLDAPRQLYSHLRGALHAGVGPEEVSGALEAALAEAGRARPRGRDLRDTRARETWARVRERRVPTPTESPS
jgi:4-carboxymuconolactone decarboxylase